MAPQSNDPIPSISEAEASGDIAVLYDDIRETLGVPVVNLIWRGLAVTPGGLDWAWTTLRPLYADGAIYSEARALRDGQTLPSIPVLPQHALRNVGVDADGEARVRTILDTYDRSNPLNLVALNALLAVLRDEATEFQGSATPPEPEPEIVVDGALPALLGLDDMDADTAALVQALNRLGARGKDHILVSMPRHLAHWPGFLALYWTLIAPYDSDGRLGDSIDAVLADGRQRGRRLAGSMRNAPRPEDATRRAVEPMLEDFSRHAIARMIPVVSLLQRAMPVIEE